MQRSQLSQQCRMTNKDRPGMSTSLGHVEACIMLV